MPNNNTRNQNRIALLASLGVGVNSSYKNGRNGRKGWGRNAPDGRPSGFGGGGLGWLPSALVLNSWYDASDASTISYNNEPAGEISVWADKSGNGYDMLMGGSSPKPIYDPAANGGLGLVGYPTGGNGETLSAQIPHSFVTGDSIRSYVLYSEPRPGIDYYEIISQIAGSAPSNTADVLRRYPKSSRDRIDFRHGPTNTQSPDNFPWLLNNETRTVLITTVRRGNRSEIWFDGELVGFSDPAPVIPTVAGNTLHILGKGTGVNQYSLKGGFNEVVFVETSLATDREKVEGYLAHKWGLADNLPIDHPYKASSP